MNRYQGHVNASGANVKRYPIIWHMIIYLKADTMVAEGMEGYMDNEEAKIKAIENIINLQEKKFDDVVTNGELLDELKEEKE